MKQFLMISILQHSYCSQLLPCIGIKVQKVAPRHEIPLEKTKRSTRVAFCLVEVLADGCIQHVLTALVIEQKYLENFYVPEEQGTCTKNWPIVQFSKPASTGRKVEQIH